jgi:hypothetical protein
MPDNHTAPGCMLRFDVSGVDDDAAVTVGFTYADVTSADPVAVRAGAAVFTDVWRASKVGILCCFIWNSLPSALHFPCAALTV